MEHRRAIQRASRRGLLTLSLSLALFLGMPAGGVAHADGVAATAQPPKSKTAPSIAGTAQVGRILRVREGRWRGASTRLGFGYQWQLCGATGDPCADVTGANDLIYTVRATDVGRTVAVVVTARNADGETEAASRATEPVTGQEPGAPVATARPLVTGKLERGATLTVQPGTWRGDPPIEYEYRWRRCTELGGACVELARREQTYVITREDEGHTLRALVFGENTEGTAAALSDATQIVPGRLGVRPRIASPPAITGVAALGRTLTASTGSWNGTPPMRFAFQWLRCTRSGESCSSIRNAAQQTHTLVEADVGRTIRVRVTASNAAGASSTTSDRTSVVAGARGPVNRELPTVSGTARQGSVLTASSGSWSGSPPISFAYQWLRCGTNGGACSAIRSATARTRALTSNDVGTTLRVRVTATNSGGTGTALSSPTAVVAPRGAAPANTSAPVLSGTARQGARLSLSTGRWSGTQPIAYSYRWERCDTSGGNCRAIEGASGNAYVLTRPDVGHRVRGVVTARNSVGSSSATSNATAVVVGAPVVTALPKINGAAVEGQTLVASTGTWVGVGPIAYGYQWTRCNAQGQFSSCVPIVVTSSPTYTLRASDVGRRVFVQVKASNVYGASFVNSELTGVVSAAPIGTVTIRSARGRVAFGTSVRLVGRVVGAPAGTRVTIVSRPLGQPAREFANAAAVGPGGEWSFVVRPAIATTYEARVRDRASVPTLVQVSPRARLRKLRPGSLSVQVVARRSFAGKTAFVQRWNAQKRRWAAVKRVRLHASRPSAVSVASFKIRRGWTVRVVLPARQAGPGYVTAISNRVRS